MSNLTLGKNEELGGNDISQYHVSGYSFYSEFYFFFFFYNRDDACSNRLTQYEGISFIELGFIWESWFQTVPKKGNRSNSENYRTMAMYLILAKTMAIFISRRQWTFNSSLAAESSAKAQKMAFCLQTGLQFFFRCRSFAYWSVNGILR